MAQCVKMDSNSDQIKMEVETDEEWLEQIFQEAMEGCDTADDSDDGEVTRKESVTANETVVASEHEVQIPSAKRGNPTGHNGKPQLWWVQIYHLILDSTFFQSKD